MLKLTNLDEIKDGYNIGIISDAEINAFLQRRNDLSCIWRVKAYPNLQQIVDELVFNPFANAEAKERFFFYFREYYQYCKFDFIRLLNSKQKMKLSRYYLKLPTGIARYILYMFMHK